MRFLFQNLYVFVFAFLSISIAVWVANGPERAARLVRPLVEDAVELKTLATGAYREIRDFNWKVAYDEFETLFVTTIRLPSLVFEKLAERLDKFNEDLSKRAGDTTPATSGSRSVIDASQPHGAAIASAMP
ncbi:hypothetical protein [Labrenzia sp. DG1229]|uniref:hypothetical protein n=1 Tax=Labrenzia sp. DG1229 TaxID=681847 RepID=UPI00056990EF|nr:hypothetical protein [Labrenzia sp. DG1229]